LVGQWKRGAVMWRLKGCPKCRGDLYVERDLSGWYEECLQCGYFRELAGVGPLNGPRSPRGEKKSVALAGTGSRC